MERRCFLLFKKVLVLLLCVSVLVLSYFVFFDKEEVTEDTFYIESGLSDSSVEELLLKDFEQNTELTVGQLLVFYSRLYGNNVSTYKEAQDFCVLKEIYLPSDLVYDSKAWETLWRESVLGNTVFKKVNDDTYAISLIQDYLTIYLNEQGYNLIKQGLIPPQLYFYSPFSGIEDFEEINLSKKATLGFALEFLMDMECEEDRMAIIHNIIKTRIEEITNKPETEWTTNEISLYNYYSLSYFGEYSYLKSEGLLTDIEVGDLTKPILISDFVIMVNKVLEA